MIRSPSCQSLLWMERVLLCFVGIAWLSVIRIDCPRVDHESWTRSVDELLPKYRDLFKLDFGAVPYIEGVFGKAGRKSKCYAKDVRYALREVIMQDCLGQARNTGHFGASEHQRLDISNRPYAH